MLSVRCRGRFEAICEHFVLQSLTFPVQIFGRIRALGSSMSRTFQRTAGILGVATLFAAGPIPVLAQYGRGDDYYSVYEMGAQIRCLVTPREASVYVDGFYAGIVDDFDGLFQRLPVTPGGHENRLAPGWVPNGSPDGLCHGRVHVQGAAQDGEAVRWRIERATAGRAACITPSGRQRRATVAATRSSAPVRPSADLRCFVVRSGESRFESRDAGNQRPAGRRPNRRRR